MKHFGLFLVFSLLLQSFAWAGPKENLKAVLDDYRYAVTVEWDQKDLEQLDLYKQAFTAELTTLVKQQKLTAKDLAQFLKEHSRELKIDANILAQVTESNGQLNLVRAQKLLEDSSDKIYLKGSSWAPLEILKYGLITLAIAEIIVLIATSKSDTCPNDAYHPNDVAYYCEY